MNFYGFCLKCGKLNGRDYDLPAKCECGEMVPLVSVVKLLGEQRERIEKMQAAAKSWTNEARLAAFDRWYAQAHAMFHRQDDFAKVGAFSAGINAALAALSASEAGKDGKK